MLTPKKPQSFQKLPPDARKSHKSFARAAGSFVPKLTAKVFERYGFHSAEIMTSWATVVGADIAMMTQPERIKWPRGQDVRDAGEGDPRTSGGATLILRAEPAHALEIEYRARDVINRINRYFGYRAIAAIKIVQAPIDRPSIPTGPVRSSLPPPNLPPLPSTIDPGLSAALNALWSSVATARHGR